MQVYGNGWEEFADSNTRSKLVINGPIGFQEIQDLMCEAKIVLNVLPAFTDGAHERVFTSMLAGAVCLSDENRYLASNFRDGEDILLYSLKDGGHVQRVAQLLDSPALLQDIADRGKKVALEKHTWLSRTRQMLGVVEAHNTKRILGAAAEVHI